MNPRNPDRDGRNRDSNGGGAPKRRRRRRGGATKPGGSSASRNQGRKPEPSPHQLKNRRNAVSPADYPPLPKGSPTAAAFEALGIGPMLASAVHAAGYETPTPIQQASIEPLLEGRDLLGCAQTGTGKTAAFALPMLEDLLRKGRAQKREAIRALILAPTRELALQIADSFCKYGRNTKIRTAVIFGGVGKQPQIDQLERGIDVLVATPGRLLDLMGDRYLTLEHLETFVLDEADRMLDMGFIHDVRRVIRELPKERQTLLFSATMPKEIRHLADQMLRDPISVAVDPVSSSAEPIQQSVLFVEKGDKPALLAKLLEDESMQSTLVFSRTKHGANKLVKKLAQYGIEAAAIHGNKSQSARQAALERFKTGEIRVLVATDIAARGIDIAGLSHVVNYDLPNEPESYVHRIGRTGRAGRAGIAIAFCATDEQPYLRDIERLIRDRVPRGELPEGFVAQAPKGPQTAEATRAPQRQAQQQRRQRRGPSGGSGGGGRSGGGRPGRNSRGGGERSDSGSGGTGGPGRHRRGRRPIR